MKYFSITFLLILLSCLFIAQTDGIFSSSNKKKSEKEKTGKCSLYKGRCGGTLSNGCCKAPYKCGKSTAVCGKDKLCCLTETDIQRHKQESGNWLEHRGGK